MDDLLTIKEAAAQLKVAERTIRRWIAQGRLEAFKIARTVRIRREAIDALTRTGVAESRPHYDIAPPRSSPHSPRQILLEDELQRMVQILVERYRPERIVLFGSAARERPGEWSDLDLFIVKETDKRFIQRSIEVAQIAQPQMAADFVVYTPAELAEAKAAGNYFVVEEILAKGRILYASDPAPTHA
jgi:excisionase family DNA binding protein